MNTSYKSMLRDRCPEVVDLALKWCKAKTRWIDHAYNHFINIYPIKEERYEATRIVLGISGKYHRFDFNRTIDWDDCTEDEIEYWKTVEGWVDWFTKRHIAIEQDIKCGLSNEEIVFKYKELSSNSIELIEYIRINL